MKDEKILAGAPQRANEIGFYDGEMFYISNYDNGHNCKVWISGQWVFSELCDFFGYIRCVRSLADIKTIVELQKRIAELEKQLLPDLFWDANNAETSFESLYELMEDRFEDGAELGGTVEVQRASLLQNETYVFTKIDDDYSFEYELQESSK